MKRETNHITGRAMRTIAMAMMMVVALMAHAEVGMWVPMFIERNITQMKEMGCNLSAEDIYSINKASLKDAVVIFGGGCTGEVVSEDGLLLTNYHCGYDAIQKLSSVEHDYLTNGFWAASRDEELACEGLSVTFLIDITDVTSDIMARASKTHSIAERENAIASAIDSISTANSKDDVTAEVDEFYGGNQYLMYRYRRYDDVRLVGAPPAEIGKFGGDTDNWVWPRHTGDFSIFRIYADKDNKPAKYSSDNRPLKPVHHLKISTAGVKEGDFTMVLGYPGSTNLYAPADYVKLIEEKINPRLVELRTAKLKVMNKYQATSQVINIQYAAKNASTSNAWKKWQGEVKGLKKTEAVKHKREVESILMERKPETREMLEKYAAIYDDNYAGYYVNSYYINELMRYGGGAIELCQLARTLDRADVDHDNCLKGNVVKMLTDFYRDYNPTLSKEMAKEALKIYCKNIDKANWPKMLKDASSAEKMVEDLYTRSALRSEKTALQMLKDGRLKRGTLMKDPAYHLYIQLGYVLGNLSANYGIKTDYSEMADLDRRYVKAMLEAYPDSLLASDANFTMRVSYGKASGYEADDAVEYGAFTTLDGVVEKYKTGNVDYAMPRRLMELYEQKAYEEYADADGRLHTAFVATNHTTGGNSGSPVLNANGELVGLNFDRAWNGVMSDMYFNPLQCRNITLDIRYLLFIVDKYGNARYLVDEMLGENGQTLNNLIVKTANKDL